MQPRSNPTAKKLRITEETARCAKSRNAEIASANRERVVRLDDSKELLCCAADRVTSREEERNRSEPAMEQQRRLSGAGDEAVLAKLEACLARQTALAGGQIVIAQ